MKDSNKTISVKKLIEEYKLRHPDSPYFDRDTLEFWGEKISDMRVLEGLTKCIDNSGKIHLCYTLSSLQRNYSSSPKIKCTLFDSETFDVMH